MLPCLLRVPLPVALDGIWMLLAIRIRPTGGALLPTGFLPKKSTSESSLSDE